MTKPMLFPRLSSHKALALRLLTPPFVSASLARAQTAKRTLLAAILLGVGAASIGASPQNSTSVPDSAQKASAQKQTWLRISAFTDIPLAGAEVAVYNMAGDRIFQQGGATNAQGVFPAPVNGLPANFRVTVTWDASQQSDLNRTSLGKFTLSADVRNFDPAHGIAYVNPVTTIVSRLLSRFPQLTQQEAEAHVRRFLVLPPNASLGAALRQGKYFSSAYFSEAAFLNQASQYGGVKEFIEVLLIDLLAQPQAKHAFPGTLQSSSGSATSFIAENLAKGALSWASGQGAGWVAQSAGLITPGATADDIANLQAGLVDLRSSVDQLSKQLAALQDEVLAQLTQTQYNTIVVPSMDLAKKVDGVEKDLTYYAQGCPTVPEGSTASVQAVSADFCTAQRDTVISELNESDIRHAFEVLSGNVLDNPTIGFKGLVHLFSQSLGQSVRFFRPADSTKIQNMFDYWDAAQTEAANLNVELLHFNGAQDNPGGIAQLTDFLGNINANPPAQGSFQDTRDAEQKLMYPALPAGTVINTKDRLMWPTDYPVVAAAACQTGPKPPASSLFNGPTITITWNGIGGWFSPSLPEIQSLIAGWSGQSPNSWLTDQTKAVEPDSPLSPGFANISTDTTGHACPILGYVWTATPTGGSVSKEGRTYYRYYVMRMDNGTTLDPLDDHDIAFLYPYSNWNWIYLRRNLLQGEQYYWYP